MTSLMKQSMRKCYNRFLMGSNIAIWIRKKKGFMNINECRLGITENKGYFNITLGHKQTVYCSHQARYFKNYLDLGLYSKRMHKHESLIPDIIYLIGHHQYNFKQKAVFCPI